MSALPNSPISAPSADAIKVLLIDDSAVIRGLVGRWLKEEAGINLVGFGTNGQSGIVEAEKHQPDVIILDIEMPVMDGISALPLLQKAAPGARIIMASTLTQRGAEVTIKALTLGATDYIAKPDASRIAGADVYKRELLLKVRALGSRRRALRSSYAPSSTGLAPAPTGLGAAPSFAPALKPVSIKAKPEAVFIGSSTGGPEALHKVVSGLVGKIHVPVFITQHMPPMFTKILAQHMTTHCKAQVHEAVHGMEALPGQFYIAPGDFHMTVTRTGGTARISLNQAPPENFCRPAVDVMMRSAVSTYGEKCVAVILTGMGHDGTDGIRKLAPTGAVTIIQDEATSVVWGMPGSVAKAGLANVSKPIDKIAPAIIDVLRGVMP